MALTGTDKEMRMPPAGSSWSSDTLQDHTDRLQVMPISVGSKLKLPSRYRECLKNHAATIGGNVTDGCGEFMPTGEDGTLEALKCAACNCHRNFHRKESSNAYGPDTAIHPLPAPPGNRHRNITPLAMHSNHWASVVPPAVKMTFGGGSAAATDSSSEELNFYAGMAAPPYGSSKKRFRTKFTAEQKDRMMEFAEKVGWRIPREDDAQVQRFCGEIGVKRQVFKVWMHNNKTTSAHVNVVTAAAVAGDDSVKDNKQVQDSSYGD